MQKGRSTRDGILQVVLVHRRCVMRDTIYGCAYWGGVRMHSANKKLLIMLPNLLLTLCTVFILEHKRKFKEWRKKHYNEYQAVQRARALMQHDPEEEGEEKSEQSEQMQF